VHGVTKLYHWLNDEEVQGGSTMLGPKKRHFYFLLLFFKTFSRLPYISGKSCTTRLRHALVINAHPQIFSWAIVQHWWRLGSNLAQKR